MTMDFSASITRIAGTRLPRQHSFDGIDILERVETNQPVTPRTLYWRARRGEESALDLTVPLLLALVVLMTGESFFANRFYRRSAVPNGPAG